MIVCPLLWSFIKTDVEAMTCSDFIKYIVTLAFIRHKKCDVVQPKHKHEFLLLLKWIEWYISYK